MSDAPARRAVRGGGPPSDPLEDRILDAAERVFSVQGTAASSLRQLVAAAGTSVRAFYSRFPSKEAVLDALIARLIARVTAEVAEELSAAQSPREGFDRATERLAWLLRPHRPLVRIALTEAMASPTTRATVARSLRALTDVLTGRLRKLESRGAIAVADAETYALAIVGTLHFHVVRWAVFEQTDDAGLARSLAATARAIPPATTK